MNRLQTFINGCLRTILKIKWPEKISNQELWQQTRQILVEQEILRRRWGWVGHTLRKPGCSTTRRALTWNPQGKRKRGRPRNTWRRELEAGSHMEATGEPRWGPGCLEDSCRRPLPHKGFTGLTLCILFDVK
ncbi:hypothetical protein RRG08_013088 [Elysia crispata]|uniref:Uncharacterized protein n=1 Tax=Elysia crispata TaxID=231223 RepID=A0AAE1A0S2_9GAST|nr:hypothetical protein RRG08_013088 [Elysia crispata]